MILSQSRNFYENDERFAPLFINSCGHFKNVVSESGIKRYHGRNDYQIIYILQGFIRFSFKNSDPIDIPKGHLVIFKPFEPQIYSCPSLDGAEYVWIHFGGEAVECLLKESNLYEKNCYFLPGCESSVRTIEKMMEEINGKQPSYQIKLMGLFCSLLSDFTRAGASCGNSCLHSKLIPALEEIENNPHAQHTLDEYAYMCHITKYHFIREFKKLKNQSPIQYRDSVCMKHAASLLEFTDMPISQIAEEVGINDSLYFSKKFKKHFGISPTEYKKTH